jgi:hypothetical protein
MKIIFLFILTMITLLGCSLGEVRNSCLDSRSTNLHQQLLLKEDKEVCIIGILTVSPHFTYFETLHVDNYIVYGGKIYLPFNYNKAIRLGLDNGQKFTYTGILSLKKTSEDCDEARCYAYYLNKT